jgi:hypothetical protein
MATRKVLNKKSPSTLRVKIGALATDEKMLASDDWFVEYKNVDTRNAIAQGLKLVDHDGDEIYSDGKCIPGFRVSFNQVLLLVNSRHNGVYTFTAYHKKPSDKNWVKWKESAKTAKEAIVGYKKREAFLKL